jgi:hypothetical protein
MDVSETGMYLRIPAQALIEKVVGLCDARPPASPVARVFGASPFRDIDLSWHAGAVGECIVAEALARLPVGWEVFHSLPIGKGESDIDHVVIGPGGIFTINSKHHSRKNVWVRGRALRVAGQHTDYIRNAEYEADRLARIIRERFPQAPAAQPVIVIVGANEIRVRTAPTRVRVEDARTVARWLRKRPVVLQPGAVDLLLGLLDDPGTWRATVAADTKMLSRRFAELSRLHDRARLIRLAWGVGAALILMLIVLRLIHLI